MFFLFVTFYHSKVDLGLSSLANAAKDIKAADKKVNEIQVTEDDDNEDDDNDDEQHNPADNDADPKEEESHGDKGEPLPKRRKKPTQPKKPCIPETVTARFNRYFSGAKIFLSIILPLVLLASQFAYIFLIFFEVYWPYRNKGGGACPGYDVPNGIVHNDPDGAESKVLLVYHCRYNVVLAY